MVAPGACRHQAGYGLFHQGVTSVQYHCRKNEIMTNGLIPHHGDIGLDRFDASVYRRNSKLVDMILDETFSPVARTRLLSKGLNPNNRLEKGSGVIGDQACLACGNCVDACPVVQERHGFVFVQNLRTSMALECMVGEECRRCYRCVNACPQVNKDIKEYASAFRRGEKIVHFLFASIVVSLAFSGITMSHYKGLIPASDFSMLSWIHRTLGVTLMLIPVIFFYLDKKHLMRLIQRSFSWGENDRQWIAALFTHIWNHKENPMPQKVQFNVGQKIWYLYSICIILTVMSVSGVVQWLGSGYGLVSDPYLGLSIYLHMTFAFVTDSLILVHFYLKYLRKWGIIVFEMFMSMVRKKHLIYSVMYKDKYIDC